MTEQTAIAFPQYAKTTDEKVITTIEENRRGWEAFHRRACDFAIAQGVEKGSYYPSSFAGSHSVRAIGGGTRPTTGQWKKGHGGYGWLPFKNNPLTGELDQIRFVAASVPGLGSLVYGPYEGWSRIAATPQPFVLDGAAYVGFSFTPKPEEGVHNVDPAEGGWVEILASEYALAVEAFNAKAVS